MGPAESQTWTHVHIPATDLHFGPRRIPPMEARMKTSKRPTTVGPRRITITEVTGKDLQKTYNVGSRAESLTWTHVQL